MTYMSIIEIASAVASPLLLATVVWFLKQTYAEFKDLKQKVTEALNQLSVHDEKIKNTHRELNGKVDNLDRRVQRIEDKVQH